MVDNQKTDNSAVVFSEKRKSLIESLLPKVVIVLIVAVLVGVGFLIDRAVVNHQNASKYAFVIDGQKFTKTQVNGLIAYPVAIGQTKAAALKSVYSALQDKIVAAKMGIVVPTDQVQSYEQNLVGTTKANPHNAKYLPWLQLTSYDAILNQIVTHQGGVTAAQGYVFYIWFNQHEHYGPLGNPPTGNGVASFIAQDRSYAQAKANTYETLLKSNGSPTSIISQINADPKINQDYILSTSGSTQFGTSNVETWQEQLNDNSAIINYINSQKKTGLSPVEVGQVSVTTNGKSENADGYFYIVKLTQLPGSAKFSNLKQNLTIKYYGV